MSSYPNLQTDGRLCTAVAVSLLMLGLYTPSSLGGVYSTALWVMSFGVLLGLLLSLLGRKQGLGSFGQLVNSILILAILIGATVFAPFPEYKWGGLLPYLALCLLLNVNLRELSTGQRFRNWLTVAHIINLTAGIAVVLRSDFVCTFLVDHYSVFYPDLVSFETSVGKPVLTFGSHSTGAFFYYLFFLLSFETYKVTQRWIYLGFALAYVGLGFALFSVTGMALMCLALFQLLRYAGKVRPRFTMIASVAAILTAVIVARSYLPDREDLIAALRIVSDVVTSPTNGFLGRFSSIGTLYSTVNYIVSYPLRPLGIAYRGDLMFGDSGIVEYYLRGSFLLVFAVYGGLLVFLRRNLVSREYAYLLFFVILAFETGFSSLSYPRTLYLLPVFILGLNNVSRERQQSKHNLRWAPNAV